MAQQTTPYRGYRDADGQSYVGRDMGPYAWNFTIVGEGGNAPAHGVLVGEFTPKWPEREQAVANAVEALRARKQSIYAEAEQEARKVEERIQNLLCLEGPSE